MTLAASTMVSDGITASATLPEAIPVIAAAGRVQGAIAGWVHQHGAWPWLVVLAVLTLAALGAAWRASATAKYRRADPATAGDEP